LTGVSSLTNSLNNGNGNGNSNGNDNGNDNGNANANGSTSGGHAAARGRLPGAAASASSSASVGRSDPVPAAQLTMPASLASLPAAPGPEATAGLARGLGPSQGVGRSQSAGPKVTLMCTALNESDQRQLRKFLAIFARSPAAPGAGAGAGAASARGPVGALVLLETHRIASRPVTHLLVGVSSERGRERELQLRTMKYLHGLMAGQWILSPQWLTDCAKARCLLPEEPYEIQASPKARKKKAPRRAREEVRVHGQSRLFDRYVVALQGDFPGPLSPTKKDLSELLLAGRAVLAGGLDELMHERYHGMNRVVLFGWAGRPEEREAEAARLERRVHREVPVVHYNWLVDSIDAYTVLSPKLYLHGLVAAE
jgi:hypothetical protein